MIKAIFLKEFFKIRWAFLVIFALNIALTIYLFISTRSLFILDHPEVVWYRVIHLGQIHFRILRYVPMISGILIACFQYLPEMWEERLRLSLHLPVSAHLLILAHVMVGLAAFGILVLTDITGLLVITAHYFPKETLVTSFITVLPWFMAGVASYLGCTLTLLEPGYRYKIFNLVIAAGVTAMFLYTKPPGCYGPALLAMIFPLFLLGLSVLLPGYRFRYRRTH